MALGRLYFAVQAVAGAVWWIAVSVSPFVRTTTLGELDPVVMAALDVPLFVVASALAAAGIRAAVWVACGWTLLVTAGMVGYATFTSLAGWGALAMIAAAGGSVAATLLIFIGRIPTEWVIAGPFRFRPARATGGYFARTLGQIVVFWGVFLVLGPAIIATIEQRWQVAVAFPQWVRIAGAVILVLSSVVGIWSAYAMSTRGEGTPLPTAMATRLVVAGPYRYVRNPMALSGIVQGAAIGLLLSSWLVVVYAVAGSLIWNWVVRPHEEADLATRFGDDYARYRDRVRCWVPRFPGFALERTDEVQHEQ